MAVQIIEFKEQAYNEAVKILNKAVESINRVIPFLIENKHPDISVPFFYQFTKNFRDVLNEYFRKHLIDVCDFFGLRIEEYN
jgi:hypothetical protein